MGLSLFTMRSYEYGKRMPCAKQMEALCGVLSVTTAALKALFRKPQSIDVLPVRNSGPCQPGAREG